MGTPLPSPTPPERAGGRDPRALLRVPCLELSGGREPRGHRSVPVSPRPRRRSSARCCRQTKAVAGYVASVSSLLLSLAATRHLLLKPNTEQMPVWKERGQGNPRARIFHRPTGVPSPGTLHLGHCGAPSGSGSVALWPVASSSSLPHPSPIQLLPRTRAGPIQQDRAACQQSPR